MSETTKRLVNGLHLFALFSFGVSQPLFDLLARYAGFFAAHQSTPREIVLLISTLVAALPLAAWLLELVAGLLAPSFERYVHLLLVGVLAAVFILPGLKHIPGLPGLLVVGTALSLGGFFVFVYARYRTVRSLLTVLAVAPLAFAGFFAFTKPVSNLVFPEEIPTVPATKAASEAPVIMVIFDDLSLTSLLDERRQIDAIRFPAFAALARESTWFRNTSTVHERTHMAVPAILTGRYPTHKALLPTGGDYPLNIFTLLQGSYRLNVQESATALYRKAEALDGAEKSGLLERLRGLYSDVAIIYLHVILPEDLATWLPPLVETWKDFAGASQSDPDKARSPRPRGRKEYFEKFLESIRPCEKSCGYFLHSLVPHPPWEYLPSGKVYHPSTVYGMESSYWGEEEWWVMQAYQRHLLQVKFVDNLLGKLLSHLKSIGMYDRSLIVVTADHGRSFWPKERHRNLNGAKYPEDILGVPLLIKAPFQRKGIVSDRNVQTIDIFPTLADLLKIQIPWPVDGCSAVSKSCPERNEKIAVDSRGKKTRFDAEVLRREDSLKRKLALFRSGTKNIGPLNVGPYRYIVGRRAAEFGVNNAVGAGVSPFPVPEWSKMDPDAFSPARVTAFFYPGEKIEGAVYVAISVDGTIQAVAPALPDKERALIVSAMLPEETVKNGSDVQFFVVRGPPEKPELYRISRK